MRIETISALAGSALLLTGCSNFAEYQSNTEKKFGRGMNNVTEFARMGEMRRSMEQTAIWDGTDQGYTTGMLRGLNRSLVRTGVGVYELVTAPIPPFEPVFLPADPVYPDAYKPSFLADPSWGPDSQIGFSGGDIAPMVPGSRFRIFDY